jgi:hypothetical protein
MLAKTLAIISQNRWFYLYFAFLVLILAAIQDAGFVRSGGGAINAILWLIFARFVHRTALFGMKFNAPNLDGSPDRSFAGFLLKGMALLTLSIALALPAMFYGGSDGAQTDTSPVPNLLPFIIVFLVIYAIVLSLAGSWLPASVYRRNPGLVAAIKRGSRNFFKVFVWIAPTLFLAIAVEFALILGSVVIGIDTSVIRDGSFNPGGAAITLIAALIESVSISLIAVVLSHFYLAAEEIAEPALQG